MNQRDYSCPSLIHKKNVHANEFSITIVSVKAKETQVKLQDLNFALKIGRFIPFLKTVVSRQQFQSILQQELQMWQTGMFHKVLVCFVPPTQPNLPGGSQSVLGALGVLQSYHVFPSQAALQAAVVIPGSCTPCPLFAASISS